ncbi:MAG: hypothetical protein V4501_00170 [Pseudomonadota bacterium]
MNKGKIHSVADLQKIDGQTLSTDDLEKINAAGQFCEDSGANSHKNGWVIWIEGKVTW